MLEVKNDFERLSRIFRGFVLRNAGEYAKMSVIVYLIVELK